MADILMKYYQYVAEQSGAMGKMKLAMVTKVPSTKAAMDPDSPETIRIFQEAVKEITGKPAPNF
ncbi:MAG: hypothetical protein WCC04_20135 [Terriglobales bacterium]